MYIIFFFNLHLIIFFNLYFTFNYILFYRFLLFPLNILPMFSTKERNVKINKIPAAINKPIKVDFWMSVESSI
jgi:hypothetical protein